MRIRTIKPEFWRSDDIDALCLADRLLFIGLWSYVDDNGVGVDKEAAIAADLFAGDLARDPQECSLRVHGGLKRLAAAGLIMRYTARGRRWLCVTEFGRHQRINRPTPSKKPLPTSDDAEIHAPLTESSVSPQADPPLGTGEQGNRGTGDTDSLRSSARAGALRAVKPLEDHEPVPESEPESINAATVVAAWVEEVTANGTRPSSSQRNQVGKIARELLRGNPPDAVLAAARAAGARGFPSIDRELTAMAGRSPTRGPSRGDAVVVRDARNGDLLEKWW